MITYELSLLFRILPKNELATVVKRAANHVLTRGGILRKLEHLGTRGLPYKASAHGLTHKEASHFVFEFNIPPTKVDELLDELVRDVDIIRRRVYRKEDLPKVECSIHEDLLPPPYRKKVQELVKEARKRDKPKFNYNTGLDYYPFQK